LLKAVEPFTKKTKTARSVVPVQVGGTLPHPQFAVSIAGVPVSAH
jgi:hypothetical protein